MQDSPLDTSILWSRYEDLRIFYKNTVEPPVSDHPKCVDLLALGRLSPKRIEQQVISSEKSSEHIYMYSFTLQLKVLRKPLSIKYIERT